MQNTPFNGAGRRPAPHPLLAIIPSPTAIYLYFVQSALCRICMYRVIQGYVAIHEMRKRKGKVPVQCAQAGRVDSLPPPPCSVGGAVGGGGRLASHVLPGDFERGRGDLWQVNSAGYSRGWIRQIFMARHFGRSFWLIYLAGHFGWFIWRVSTSKEKNKLLSKGKKCIISESVDCIMSLYISQ